MTKAVWGTRTAYTYGPSGAAPAIIIASFAGENAKCR